MSYQNTQTDFNSNQFRICGINDLIEDCNYYRRKSFKNGYDVESLKLWKTTLKSLHLDVNPKMTNKERAKIKEFWKRDLKIGPVHYIKKTPDGPIVAINHFKFQEHWNALYKIEDSLRLIADKKGMLLTNRKNNDGETPEDW